MEDAKASEIVKNAIQEEKKEEIKEEKPEEINDKMAVALSKIVEIKKGELKELETRLDEKIKNLKILTDEMALSGRAVVITEKRPPTEEEKVKDETKKFMGLLGR